MSSDGSESGPERNVALMPQTNILPSTAKASSKGLSNQMGQFSQDTFLGLLESALKGGGFKFPVPQIPLPHKPASSSSRGRERHRRRMEVWECADEIRVCLNEMWYSCPYFSGEDSDGPLPKVKAVKSAAVGRSWSRLSTFGKLLSSVRRESFGCSPTGAELWSRLRKTITDIYGFA